MTRDDFDLIIIESILIYTKQSYYETKRKEFDCLPSEYIRGLDESLKRLQHQTNVVDYHHYILTYPDGECEEGKFRLGFEDEPCYIDERTRLEEYGVLSYPFKTNINVSEKTNGRFNFKITEELLAKLLIILEDYFRLINTQNSPSQNLNDHLIPTKVKIAEKGEADFGKALLEIDLSQKQNQIPSRRWTKWMKSFIDDLSDENKTIYKAFQLVKKITDYIVKLGDLFNR